MEKSRTCEAGRDEGCGRDEESQQGGKGEEEERSRKKAPSGGRGWQPSFSVARFGLTVTTEAMASS